MVLRAVSSQLVALADEELGERLRVRAHLLGVRLELGCGHLLELRGQTGDLVVVRPTLERGEDGEVDRVLVLVLGRTW